MSIYMSVIIFMCLFMLVSVMGSYLMLLIFLELLMFFGFLFFFSLGSLFFSGFHFLYNLIFLVMMIFEGVFGLSLMLSVSRGEGSDLFFKC